MKTSRSSGLTRLSYRQQDRERDEEVDSENDGKTTSEEWTGHKWNIIRRKDEN